MNATCPHCQKPVVDALAFTKKHRDVGRRILNEQHGQNRIRDHINKRLHLVPMFVTKVAAHNGLTLDELLSESRRRERVQVRHALLWFLAEHTTLALVTIAGIFGRHHASVIHARKTIPKLLSVGDPDTVGVVDMVMDMAADIWKPETSNPTT
jgi:chromosomal replication initiation ATPase DnaA